MDLIANVLIAAANKEWVPSRSMLDEISKHFTKLPINHPIRDWWSAHLMSYLNGHDGPTNKTRAANQLLMFEARPEMKDAEDWALDW